MELFIGALIVFAVVTAWMIWARFFWGVSKGIDADTHETDENA